MVVDNHANCKCVKAVIIYDPASKMKEITDESAGLRVMRWDTMMKWAEAQDKKQSGALSKELESRMKKVTPGQCCNIVYTSGIV